MSRYKEIQEQLEDEISEKVVGIVGLDKDDALLEGVYTPKELEIIAEYVRKFKRMYGRRINRKSNKKRN